jgi:nitroreductase
MHNATDHPVHDVFRMRHSPYEIDPHKPVSTEDLQCLFEAARWSMSAFNAQPWRYIVANRANDKPLWESVLATLVDGNQPWAQYAPVLALGFTVTHYAHNGKENSTAQHDLGAASAFLTMEATTRGLVVHQMAGIVPDKIKQTFDLPEHVEPFTALAIGYAGENPDLPNDYKQRDQKERQRLALSEILLHSSL